MKGYCRGMASKQFDTTSVLRQHFFFSRHTEMSPTNSEIAVCVLLAIHVVISLIFMFLSKNRCSGVYFPLAWLLSFIVCVLAIAIVLLHPF